MGELYNPFPKLPKHIRQIGEPDSNVRFYMEDYVNTYLKRLHPSGNQSVRAGLLLGNVEYNDGVPYVFIDGAMEMEDIETDGEKVMFTESAWKAAYQQIESTFPKRTIQGWFLCGDADCQLSPLNYWKLHSRYFAGKNQLMYLNHDLDGDEAVYITSEDGFYRLKGHFIYYERNQMMQDYMITRKDVKRVESSSQETVIRDFRSRLSDRKVQANRQNRTIHAMGTICAVLTVAVLAGSVALVNNYTKMKQMESVLTSVLPGNAGSRYEKEHAGADTEDFVIEELRSDLKPMSETVENTKTEWVAGAEPVQAAGAESELNAAHADGEQELPNRQVQLTQTQEPLLDPEETRPLQQEQQESQEQKESQEQQKQAEHMEQENREAAAEGLRSYIVKEGETLYGICWETYGNLLHFEEICELNRLQNVDKILAGQKLLLP